MPSLVLVIPGDLETRSGGYGYDRRVVAGLRDRGWAVDVERLDDSFPQPSTNARDEAARVLADIPDGALVMIDGLALGVLPSEVERERARLRLVALVHHPLADETGLDAETAALYELSERRALAASRLVVVTSRATASGLERYGVTDDRIVTIEPGTDRAPLARGSSSRAVRLLCVASLIPRKGHETLVKALARIRDRDWHLICVGSLERNPSMVQRVLTCLKEDGLVDRVTFTGDLDTGALAIEYDRADVCVLPTFHEGYGMVVAEALARGLPVVSTPTGGIADLLSDGAGLLVAPGDVTALTVALSRVIDDGALRSVLAAGARRARGQLPTWEDAAAKMAAALERVNHDV